MPPLRAVGDRRAQRLARTTGAEKVPHVRGRRSVVAREIDTRAALRLHVLLHQLPLHVVLNVAVAVEADAAIRAVDGIAPAALEQAQTVAALTLPHDPTPAVELEGHFLCVGKLPVVIEVIAPSRRRHGRRKIHAKGEAAEVDAYAPPCPSSP